MPETLATLARVCLLATLAAGPWLIGSVRVAHQLWLAAGVLVAAVCWGLAQILSAAESSRRRTIVPLSALAASLFAVVVVMQLIPWTQPSPISTRWQAELAEDPEVAVTDSPGFAASVPPSISPHTTRFELARLGLALCVLVISADLFSERRHRVWLYSALAVTGASLALFGMAQRLSWNDKLFWSIPLRFGGQPFASFVNRNNAAGFLNLCLAASLGGVMLYGTEPPEPRTRSRTAVFCVLLLLVAAGVAISLSRGGLLAAVCATLVVLPWLFHVFRERLAIGLAVTLLGGVALVAWLGFDGQLEARLRSLRSVTSALGLRLSHWRETFPAILDRPWLGSGAGTYRYVNRPYQEQVAPGWFWNADNQYFEVLVEDGILGGLALLLLLGVLVRDVVRLARQGPRSPNRDLLVAAMFALVAVGLQQATDFGITLLALLFPAAALAGAVGGAAAGAGPQAPFQLRRPDDPLWTPAPLPVRSLAVPVALAVLLVAGLAGYEVWRAEPAATFCDTLPLDLAHPASISPAEADALLLRGGQLLRATPDHAELAQAVSRLLIYRYRQEFVRQAEESGHPPPGASWWALSNPEQLYRSVCLAPDEEARQALREDPLVRQYLGIAQGVLAQARQGCDWLPGLHQRMALLAFLEPGSPDPRGRRWLRRAAVLDAAEPPRLLATSYWALQAHDDDLALRCCRRVLDLAPEQQPDVWQVARLGLDDVEIAERLLQSPEELFAFAADTSSASAREDVRQRIVRFSQQALASGERGRHAYLAAQASRLAGQPSAAIESMRQAVSLVPQEVDWRVELADLLLESGMPGEARAVLAEAVRQAPQRSDLRRRLEAAIREELTRPVSGPDQ
jgi:O-antigen ligase/tetratricopeptide (TPR) repeat protein